jgi:hypothetical protein
MTSQISPTNIDGTYPIAGVDNDSQGFRTNFANTSTNLAYAKTEIEAIQQSAILKVSVGGESIDNDLQGAVMQSATIKDFRETVFAHGVTPGATATLNHLNGHHQTLTTNAPLTLSFSNLPATTLGRIRLTITVAVVSHTVTIPAAVSIGTGSIAGYSANVITFGATGTYVVEFTSSDGGTTVTIEDLTRSLVKAYSSVPASSVGVAGDLRGDQAIDGTKLYACVADYDGAANIWRRITMDATAF